MVKKTAKFHQFSRLPFELRAWIWELTEASPRVVEIRRKLKRRSYDLLCEASTTPAPGILHACRESRRSAIKSSLYQRAFTQGAQARYTWINFEMDMISIKPIDLRPLKPYKTLVQRLRFEGPNDEGFFYHRCHELRDFTNMKEVHVVCTDGHYAWAPTVEAVWFGCENVWYINASSSGLMISSQQLGEMYPGDGVMACEPGEFSRVIE